MIRRKYPEKILAYEAGGFLAIIAMILLDEIFEFPKRFFTVYTNHPEVWEGSFEIITILVIAITILLMTNRLVSRLFYLEGFLRVCAWCRKINHEGGWNTLEDYFSSGFDTRTTHGMCPECFEKTMKDRDQSATKDMR